MTAKPTESVTELVYDDEATQWIVQRWPQTVVTDASDFVHEGRSEVFIPGVTEDEFYPAVMREGWAGACFTFELMLRVSDKQGKIRRWLDQLKAEEQV